MTNHSYRSRLLADLQTCQTPHQVLDRVGRKLTASADPTGEVARLALVRLSKQLIVMDNNVKNVRASWLPGLFKSWSQQEQDALHDLTQVMLHATTRNRDMGNHDTIENTVEGIKALSVISRLVPGPELAAPVVEHLYEYESEISTALRGRGKLHLLCGLDWAVKGMRLRHPDKGLLARPGLPEQISKLVSDANLPFCIHPGLFANALDEEDRPGNQLPPSLLSVDQFSREVDFRVETIRTASQKVVPERRQTAWQGDETVGPFLYSGKAMPRQDWSPTVRAVRDALHSKTGQYYDCCLLNLYPDGGSGMRYHVDPDQGTLWNFDTAVVSVGATRRFAFRAIDQRDHQPPHNFVVMDGDVTHMYGDCQERFQHTVKKAEQKDESAPRVSLVYKQTWSGTKFY